MYVSIIAEKEKEKILKKGVIMFNTHLYPSLYTSQPKIFLHFLNYNFLIKDKYLPHPVKGRVRKDAGPKNYRHLHR